MEISSRNCFQNGKENKSTLKNNQPIGKELAKSQTRLCFKKALIYKYWFCPFRQQGYIHVHHMDAFFIKNYISSCLIITKTFKNPFSEN